MSVRAATPGDVEWIVAVLKERRETLVQQAPVFWRPAPDAATKSRDFIEYLLADGGARGYRTDDGVLIATPRGDGWLVDDMYVRSDRWADGDGKDLWDALTNDVGGSEIRFVCPTYELHREDLARVAGLTIAESWWLRELDSSGGESNVQVQLPGAKAVTVPAPPVYAPPGPILFLPSAPSDPSVAIPAAVDKAEELGCASVVVNVVPGADELVSTLRVAKFRRHCDYYTRPAGRPG
ncbi:hypothetical protein [Ruania alba]|uniref:N-acetyltransferase domain-containing protein n=1 Tax=Ruania alba TaxID=648782 RepID=A0A1H5G1X4_9MICO|nr:hypothetical protein [Ruania alba]SEE09561.1 hypothetical protein SAMN04488554_1512 [Ruania alba]